MVPLLDCLAAVVDENDRIGSNAVCFLISSPASRAIRLRLPTSFALHAKGAERRGYCAAADGQSGRAALAACAARRWLTRNAAGVKLICTNHCMEASACISLVSCLPALQDVTLWLDAPLVRDDLGCLLEALAWCTRLRALDLSTVFDVTREDDAGLHYPFPDAAAFAKLGSLTKLALNSNVKDQFRLADIVSALVPLMGLAELYLELAYQPDAVPAALGQLKGLQSLTFKFFLPCVLEAGCLDLPNLLSLTFEECRFKEDAQMLPGITALQHLTRIEFMNFQELSIFDPQLVQLPRLQHLVIKPADMCDAVYRGVSPGCSGYQLTWGH